MFRTSRATIILLCIGVMVQSAMSFRQEFGVVSVLRGTMSDQIVSWTDAGYREPVPASARAVRDLLTACAKLKRFAPRLKAEPQIGAMVSARCGAMADRILVDAPTNARARALLLLVAADLRPADLAAAQKAAPYEPWPLIMRIAAIGTAGPLTPDLQVLAKADFARALETSWGRTEMAGLYTARVDLRDLVQAALEGLPPAAQIDFIRKARRSGTPSGFLQ